MRWICGMVLFAIVGCVDVAVEHSEQSGITQPDRERAKLTARRDATEINEAAIRGDFETVVSKTLDRVVELSGGRKQMIALIIKGNADLKAAGMAVQAAEIGDPSEPIAHGNEQFLVVPLALVMSVPGGTLRSPTFLIGASNDRGETWKVVNGDVAIETVKRVIPNLPTQLKLPFPEKPIFYPASK